MKPNGSQIIALIAIFLVAGWFGLNSLSGSNEPDVPEFVIAEDEIPSVIVEYITAKDHTRWINVYGRTEAIREVMVKAETTGLVTYTPLKEGQKIRRGQLMCRQDVDARQANLDQANALLRTRELEYNAARTLVDKGYRSETDASRALAALDGARAGVKQAEIELSNVNILAPFSGIFERQIAHIGDYLAPGQACGLLVDLDPLIIAIELTENQIGGVEIGQVADIELATGETISGTVRLIEARANPSTRTFRTEVVVPNSEFALKAGVTATVKISAGEIKAQQIPSHVITLNDDGDVGVRYIDGQNIVRFAKTETIDEDRNGIWVTGLPDQTRLIVKGQDFVSEGSEVDPRTGSSGTISQ